VIAIFPSSDGSFSIKEIMLALFVFKCFRNLCSFFNDLRKLPVIAVFPFRPMEIVTSLFPFVKTLSDILPYLRITETSSDCSFSIVQSRFQYVAQASITERHSYRTTYFAIHQQNTPKHTVTAVFP